MRDCIHPRGMRLAFAAALLALAGCATTPTADVVRFHDAAPVSRGTIAVEPLRANEAGSLEFASEAQAVAAELSRLGFQPLSGGTAQFRALVGLETAERSGVPRRSGLSIGLGGGFSSGNVGLGSGVTLPVGGKVSADSEATTTLTVRILTNPGATGVWEGRASLDTGPKGQRGAALAPLLARVLFDGFPGPNEQTVKVPIR